MNIKNEAIFMTLSGYAARIIEENDRSLNRVPLQMSREIIKHFNNPRIRYSPIHAIAVAGYLKNKIDPVLSGRSTMPSVLLLITLNYLLNEINHVETGRFFSKYKKDVAELIKKIEESQEYKKDAFATQRLLCSFI